MENKNENKKLFHGEGVCPICGKLNINYGREYFDDYLLIFPATCEDCGTKFRESYIIDYFRKENIETKDGKFYDTDQQ